MNQTLARKMLNYRWLIFGVMAVGYVFVYFHRLCPAVVALDLQRDFQTTGTFLGLLASAYFYPYALMQLPAGLLSDSLGPRLTVTLFLGIAALGSVLFSYATTVDFAVGARVMVGLGVSMVFIPTMKILSQWFRVREFAFMAGILNTMGGVGALTAAAPLALTSALLGWQTSFRLIGIGTFVIGIMVFLFVRNRPKDMGWPSISEIEGIASPVSVQTKPIPLWEGAKRVVTEKYFWPVAIWFFFLIGVFFGFGGLWGGPYLMHVYGMTKQETGSVLNMVAVGLIVGSPLVSFLSDKVFYSRKKIMAIDGALLVVVMAILNLFPAGIPHAGLYALFLIFSVVASAIVVIGFTTAKELFPVEIAGTSVGTVNLFPFLGGAIFQPLMGWILEKYPKEASGAYSLDGYRAMLLFLLVAAVIAFMSTFFMKETFPEVMKKRS